MITGPSNTFGRGNSNTFGNSQPYSMSPLLNIQEMSENRINGQTLDFLNNAYLGTYFHGNSRVSTLFTGIRGNNIEVNILADLKDLGLPEFACNAIPFHYDSLIPTNGLNRASEAEQFARRMVMAERGLIDEDSFRKEDRILAAKEALKKFSESTGIKANYSENHNICFPVLVVPPIQSSKFLRVNEKSMELELIPRGEEKSHSSFPTEKGLALAFNTIETENVMAQREYLDNYYTFLPGQTSHAEALVPSKYKSISVSYLLNISQIPNYQKILEFRENLKALELIKEDFIAELGKSL